MKPIQELLNDKDYKDVAQEYALRLARVGIFLATLFFVTLGVIYTYMIVKSNNIAHVSAVLFGYLLIIISVSMIFYICFTPVFTWIWSGKAKFYGDKYEGDVVAPTLLLSFVLIAVGIVILYNCGLYVSKIDKFYAWVNSII